MSPYPLSAVIVALIVVDIAGMTARGVEAAVVRVDVNSREPVMDGKPFGEAGAYEKITGTVHLAFDPEHAANARVVDLGKAPRNQESLVEARANFMVLRPRLRGPGPQVALLEVSNRGGKAALAYFNDAAFSANPRLDSDFGDGFLLRNGFILVWVGWQFDVPPGLHRLRLQAPVGRHHDGPIRGLVRSDWVVRRPAKTLFLGHRGHLAYPVSDTDDPRNVLTVRDAREGSRQIVSRARWDFARDSSGTQLADPARIHMPTGFLPGRIYELVYVAENPAVAGLGLATIRDVAAHGMYGPDNPFSADRYLAFGVSQSGRFLRHFLYQGFNGDARGRRVFDGMLIHTAGAGRGSFNHRFAQPSRDAHRYSAFFYPTDLFPFSGRSQRDAASGREDGLLANTSNPSVLPKVFYTNTGYEYWGRAASLLHTTPDGREDVPPLPNERIYHLASGQHFVARFPANAVSQNSLPGIYLGNPLDYLVNLRSLILRLRDWIVTGRAPPDSAFPRIADSTLVPVRDLAFPRIPGIVAPEVVHVAYRADYGPQWSQGIITYQPPRLGLPFSSLVPQVDSFGNELGGIRNVELAVPLATFTPWSLIVDDSGPRGELRNFVGNYAPMPRNRSERQSRGDSRPAIVEVYATKDDYLRRVRLAADKLVADGYLLATDVPRVLRRSGAYWNWIMDH